MKVLVSAFSCCPGRGSEPGIGWNWVEQISRKHELWLLTSDEFSTEINQAIRPNIHATFIPSFKLWHRLQRMLVPGLDWIYYYWWQWKAYRIARKLHAEVNFDLAHHATFASWRVPSFLCLLPVPFVWGPVGGGESVVWSLLSELSWKGRMFELFREVCQHLPRWDPFVRLTIRRAEAIVPSNPDTARVIPSACAGKLRPVLSSNGVSGAEATEAQVPLERPDGLVVLFAGVLQPRKGAGLAIKAFQQMNRSGANATLVLLGDGPERASLERLARGLGVADRLLFMGWLPRSLVLGWMKRADIFLFPSLRDSGGFVLLEAMMASRPVVCLDSGGPSSFVTEDCGIKVKPSTPSQTVVALAGALLTLSGDPALRARMGKAGRQRVLELYEWDRKGEQILRIFEEVAVSARCVSQPKKNAV